MANLKQEIEKLLDGEPTRFYGIVGKEQIRVERVWQHLAKKLEIFSDGKWLVPVKKIKLTETNISQLKSFIAEGSELSLFSSKKVFIIEQLEKVKANQVDELIKILELNNDNYYFFLGEGLLKTSRLRKAISKSGGFIEIPALKTAELTRWVSNEFKTRGLDTTTQTIHSLIELAEDSIDQITKMIDLLELYSDTQKIELEDLEELFRKPPQTEEYEWINAISNGDKQRATSQILLKLRQGDEPFPMLGMIFNNYFNYYLINRLASLQLGQNEIRSALGANPYAFKHQYTTAKKKTSEDLRKDLKLIITTDTKFKNKSLGYDELLTNLVENLS